MIIFFPQLLYQQMRSAYNDQKKPLDQMKDKVQQLLAVLGESKQPQKRPGNAASKSLFESQMVGNSTIIAI